VSCPPETRFGKRAAQSDKDGGKARVKLIQEAGDIYPEEGTLQSLT